MSRFVSAAKPNGAACVAVLLEAGSTATTLMHDITTDNSYSAYVEATLNPALGTGTGFEKQLLVSSLGSGTVRFTVDDSNGSTLPSGALFTVTYFVQGASVGLHTLGGSVESNLTITDCTGDCSGDGSVSLGELQRCVNAYLGNPLCQVSDPTSSCPTADGDGDLSVSIGEVQQCINGYLTNCGPLPTHSPTVPVPIVPSPTATPTASSTASSTVSPTPTVTVSCPTANFLDVSAAAGPGGSYSSLVPSLSVSCGASAVTVTSNGIPTYQYVAMTPNGLQSKAYSFGFPRFPSVALTTTAVSLLGNIGVAVNGIPIYAVNEGAQPASDAYGDPIAANILDQCGSHSAQQGTFHHHKLVTKCLLQSAVSSSQPWNDADPSSSVASPIIGYAFDGFAIYGPYECTDTGCSSVQTMLSGWDSTGHESGSVGCVSDASCTSGYCTDTMVGGVKTTACVPKTCIWSNNAWTAKSGTQYLDPCNGHYGPQGDYHYHATDTFPYTLGCYRGTPTNNGGSGSPPGGSCAAVPTPGATFTPTP